MIRVLLSPPLRRLCDGHPEVVAEGGCVLEVVQDICTRFPRLRSRVLRSESEISSSVFIYGADDALITGHRESVQVERESRLRLYAFVGGG